MALFCVQKINDNVLLLLHKSSEFNSQCKSITLSDFDCITSKWNDSYNVYAKKMNHCLNLQSHYRVAHY